MSDFQTGQAPPCPGLPQICQRKLNILQSDKGMHIESMVLVNEDRSKKCILDRFGRVEWIRPDSKAST